MRLPWRPREESLLPAVAEIKAASAETASVTRPLLSDLIALRERTANAPHLRLRGAGAGTHLSPQAGRGMEFAEVRPYQPGDDIRNIDWRHTARRGRPYTKLFHEEREQVRLLLVDLGPNMQFGTRVAFKSVIAARAAALLTWATIDAGDRIGGVIWDGETHHDFRPSRHAAGALPLIRQLANTIPTTARPAAGLSLPLRALARVTRPQTRIVVISDFDGLDATAETELVRLSRHAALGLVHVYDPLEATAPPPGQYRVADEHRTVTLDLRSETARLAYTATFRERASALARLAQRVGATLITLRTSDDPIAALQALDRLRPQPSRATTTP